jgi:serine/threonine protein kinase
LLSLPSSSSQVVTDEIGFVVESCDQGDLNSAIPKLDLFQKVDYAVAAAEAIHCLHKAGVVHGDVKPDNFLLRGDGSLVLSDFGTSHVERSVTVVQRKATYCYAAPEQLSKKLGKVTPKTDVYCFSGLLLHLFVGVRPYGEMDDGEILSRLLVEKELPDEMGQLKELNGKLHDLVLSGLSFEESKRPSMESMLSSLRSLFKGLSFSSRLFLLLVFLNLSFSFPFSDELIMLGQNRLARTCKLISSPVSPPLVFVRFPPILCASFIFSSLLLIQANRSRRKLLC